MTQTKRRWRTWLLAGTAALALGGVHSAARAAEAPQSEVDELRQEVRDLLAQVRDNAARDQAQIHELSGQVEALQAQLASAQAAAPPPQTIPGAPAQAAAANVAVPRVVQNATKRFALQSADGQYSIGLTGNIQFDAGGYDFRPSSKLSGPQGLSSGVNARRARIGIIGTAAGDWNYAFVYDAGNSSDQTAKGIETLQLVYSGFRGVALEIGYSNTYFTLDQSTSSADTLFLERASPSNIATNFNTGDSRANAGVRVFGDRYWLGAYVTGPASGDSHTLTSERLGAFQRAAFQVVNDKDRNLHFGIGIDELLQAPNSGNGTPDVFSVSDQPELRIDPTTLLNTGTLGSQANPVTKGYVFNLETAATWKRLFWQGEYYHYRIDRRGLPTNAFDGAYGELAWSLTGEQHRYNPQAAAYYRPTPAHPFSLAKGEWGAWEIAARYSYVDLDSRFTPGEVLANDPAAVDGGRQRGYTLGLNWYPNDLVRLLLDYDHIDYDKANGVVTKGLPLGAPIGARSDAVSLRVQVVY